MIATAEVTAPALKETLAQLNLRPSEYDLIVQGLGREPNPCELGMFSVLWSEHCCYKHSKHLLKTLPTEGERILQGPGENAGVVKIDDEIAIAFKIESHNHPTAVEPFQGATTGVGGILRDIFTMNARPIANLNALRFGPQAYDLSASVATDHDDNHRNRYLFQNAVAGIAHYGNCVGVPTIGGEMFFAPGYSENPLVNAMAIGVLYNNQLMASGAKGVGNAVLYVGSATGKDGMGGAAFASKELDENSGDDRPAVQVGDPFSEKLLIESCLEAFATGGVEAAQDMGAAGLTCSSAEMAAKGGVGMRIDLDKAPAREPNMTPAEFLLSESQERMLMVLHPGREQDVIDVFAKWGVPAVIVGQVTDDGMVTFTQHGAVVVNVPAQLLTDGAPMYPQTLTPAEPQEALERRQRSYTFLEADIGLEDVPGWVVGLLKSDNMTHPSWVYRQYDRHVQNNTVLTSDNNASGVVRLRRQDGSFSGQAIAATTDCNTRHVLLNPKVGAMGAVAEAARNLVCVGAKPLAVTNNLNFGNPEKPAIYYQLQQSVEGMAQACDAFNTPVTGGNVSLYNEHSGDAIDPAPVIGMVGLLEDDTSVMSPRFKAVGHEILLVGPFKPALGGSEFQWLETSEVYGEPPTVDLAVETDLQKLMLHLMKHKRIASAQDVSLGGLLPTVLECAFGSVAQNDPSFGVSLDLTALKKHSSVTRLDELLFGETHGSIVVTAEPDHVKEVMADAEIYGLSVVSLGLVTVLTEVCLTVDDQNIQFSLADGFHAWKTGLA